MKSGLGWGTCPRPKKHLGHVVVRDLYNLQADKNERELGSQNPGPRPCRETKFFHFMILLSKQTPFFDVLLTGYPLPFMRGAKTFSRISFAIRFQSYFCTANSFAFLTMRAVKTGSSMYFLTARATVSGLRSGSERKSGMPPTGVATTGSPAANASINAAPNPSTRDGRTKISEILKYIGRLLCSICPTNFTRTDTPS